MAQTSRLALGIVQPDVDIQPALWALLWALRERGIDVQTFRSRACFAAHDGPAAITGVATRHLDSWLMTRDVCRALFLRNLRGMDLGLVEGTFLPDAHPEQLGGRLETLCEWLDIPAVAVLDVSRLTACRLPAIPKVDGLLLDRVRDANDAFRWQVNLEALWGIPVLGALEEAASLRNELSTLAAGIPPPEPLYEALGRSLSRFISWRRLLETARSRRDVDQGNSPGLAADDSGREGVRVAVAYDDCFYCYFADSLDQLVQRGVTLQVFSPLHDECLPPNSDILWIGCGHPERHAQELSRNTCLNWAIRDHVASGKRVYAEGAGVGYLAEVLDLGDGEVLEMTGVLPIACRMRTTCAPASPCEIEAWGSSWVAPRGTTLRGYRNHRWYLERSSEQGSGNTWFDDETDPSFAASPRVAASLVHLDFAADPALLTRFCAAE